MTFNLILGVENTQFVHGNTQVTCYGHLSGSCELEFPHRMGSKGCYYNEDDRLCDACLDEACDFHDNYGPDVWYYEQSEALTAGERNPSLARGYAVGYGNV